MSDFTPLSSKELLYGTIYYFTLGSRRVQIYEDGEVYDDLEIEEKVVKLIQKCNNRGGLDNISIAYLIKNEEGENK